MLPEMMNEDDARVSFNFLKRQTNDVSPFYTDEKEFILKIYTCTKEMKKDFFKNKATILNLEFNASWGEDPIKDPSKWVDNRYGINHAIDNCSTNVKCIKLGWNQLLSLKELKELITKIKTNVVELHLSGMSLFYNFRKDDISSMELFGAIPQNISYLNIEDNGLIYKENELIGLLSKLPKHIRHVKVGGLGR